MRLNALTQRNLRRFRRIRTGVAASIVFAVLLLFAAFAELLVGDRALVVRYDGELHFPVYGSFFSGRDFGLDYDYEVDYLELRAAFAEEEAAEEEATGNFVWMPPIPHGPNRVNYYEEGFPPYPPDPARGHWLGTDTLGRDVLARLLYGFRVAILFALAYTALVYLIGILVGCAMGYFGSLLDLIGVRVMEIWSNIPFLYVVFFIASAIPAALGAGWRISLLLLTMVAFNWVGLAYYMRTGTFREKARDYVAAARVIGASHARIIRKHILPNLLSTLVTFLPFTIAGAITSITALDFLGFGLPPPTPSWGELLDQGRRNLNAPWIVLSAFSAIVVVLTLITFIGEAIREASDPRQFTTYR